MAPARKGGTVRYEWHRKITQRIDADAQAEIDKLLAAARAEAEGIAAKYHSQAEREAAS